MLAWMGPERTHPQRPLVDMVRFVLSTRINLRVRNEKGLAYSAHATYVPARTCGMFLAYARTRKERLKDAVLALLGEVESMRTRMVPPKAMRYVKNYFANALCHRFATCYDVLEQFVYIDHYGLGRDYFDRRLKAVQRAGCDDLMRVALMCVPRTGYVLVLVGDKEAAQEAAKVVPGEKEINVLGDGK